MGRNDVLCRDCGASIVMGSTARSIPDEAGWCCERCLKTREETTIVSGLIAPGTRVMIGPDRDVPAEVISVQIHADLSVTYQVEWFCGQAQQTAWKARSLITLQTPSPLQIGFTFGSSMPGKAP